MLIANRTDNLMQLSVIGEIMGENEWMASDAAYMRAALDAADGLPVDMWVSSPGGSLDAALAMRAMLSAHASPVVIHTAGIVASAATLLLCVPNARVIAERGSVFMVHTTRMGADGDARDMRKAADILDACDDEILEVYKLRMKCGDDELKDMIAAETWLRSSEAVAVGLVDEVAGATSGGFIAEPRNPDPLPDAVSARLRPEIDAICAGMKSISATGEQRIQAINGALSKATGEIDGSARAACGAISSASDSAVKAMSSELDALRAELSRVSEVYAESAKKYAALDTALSTVYALVSGQTGFPMHDEQLRKSQFKLNI